MEVRVLKMKKKCFSWKNYCKLSTHICKCWSFCEYPGERIIATYVLSHICKCWSFHLTAWLIIFKQIIFSRHRIQSLNLISHFLQIQYNSEQMLNFFLQTNKIQEHLKLDFMF
jgi:hypothetical protein